MPEITYILDSSEENIYLVYYPPHYAWEDYHKVIDAFIEVTQGRRVHFINVYLPGARLPVSNPVPHQRRTVRVLNVGITIYVSTDTFFILSMRTFHKLLNREEELHFKFVDTLEDARLLMPNMIQDLAKSEARLGE